MCTHAQTPYRPSVLKSVRARVSVHMHTSPRLYVCMYVCEWVCARVHARERAYVCVLSYTNVQVHTRDFSWACKRACACMRVC